MDKGTDGWMMNVWIDGQMDGWADIWMGGWIDR